MNTSSNHTVDFETRADIDKLIIFDTSVVLLEQQRRYNLRLMLLAKQIGIAREHLPMIITVDGAQSAEQYIVIGTTTSL